MSIEHGYTDAEIRTLVFEYERRPWGTRMAWLESQRIPWRKFRSWQRAVYDGDVERGMVPRSGGPMTSPAERRRIAKEREDDDYEKAYLREQIRRLEDANEALGKAIGLLHQQSEQEPDDTETGDTNSS